MIAIDTGITQYIISENIQPGFIMQEMKYTIYASSVTVYNVDEKKNQLIMNQRQHKDENYTQRFPQMKYLIHIFSYHILKLD